MSSSSDSGPDDRGPAKKKSKSEGKGGEGTSKGKNEEGKWEIGDKRFVTVREFKGRTFVDIREFYEKEGEMLPGRKGISLKPDQLYKLQDVMKEIVDYTKSK